MAETDGRVACPPDDRYESGVSRSPNEKRPRGGHVESIRLKLGYIDRTFFGGILRVIQRRQNLRGATQSESEENHGN